MMQAEAATKPNDLRQSRRFLSLYTPPKIDGDFMDKHTMSVDQLERKDLQTLFDATFCT